jgi:hypothetical protein
MTYREQASAKETPLRVPQFSFALPRSMEADIKTNHIASTSRKAANKRAALAACILDPHGVEIYERRCI